MPEVSLLEHLRRKHPGAFEGWDEFHTLIQARQWLGGGGEEVLVALYNKGDGEESVIELHNAFLVTGDDHIRVGKYELVQEWTSAYIPPKYMVEEDEKD